MRVACVPPHALTQSIAQRDQSHSCALLTFSTSSTDHGVKCCEVVTDVLRGQSTYKSGQPPGVTTATIDGRWQQILHIFARFSAKSSDQSQRNEQHRKIDLVQIRTMCGLLSV
jgi:hypothetical protein